MKLLPHDSIESVARIFIALVVISLTIYTFIDCLRTPAYATPARISKVAWALLTLLVPIIGPILWLFFKYQAVITSDKPISASDISERLRTKRTSSHTPIAPDDDPEFLARLDARNRRKAYEDRKSAEQKKSNRPHKDKSHKDHPTDHPTSAENSDENPAEQ